MDLSKFIRDIPDFPKPGILFKDITPLIGNPEAFQHAIDLLYAHYQGNLPDAITAAEARGFIFSAPLALKMGVPLIPMRKPGKLPFHTHSLQYELEYGQAELHVHIDGLAKGARVLVVDDLLATGGTLRASCQLAEKAGAKILGCAVIIELTFLKGRDVLRPYDVFSLVKY